MNFGEKSAYIYKDNGWFTGGIVAIKYSRRLIGAGAALIVVVSVSTTFLVAHWFTSGHRVIPATVIGYKNITFTDAVLACRSEAESKLPRGLFTLTLDDHSSRFEQGEGLYKIFFQAQVKRAPDDTDTVGVAVFCFVKADRGFVSYYEQLEQTDESAPVLDKPGGVFGWPI